MPEYIERDYLMADRVGNDPVRIAAKCAPAADVEPVRHGWWNSMQYVGGILDGTKIDKCSVCGYERVFEDEKLKKFFYCPKCGSKMDLEETK